MFDDLKFAVRSLARAKLTTIVLLVSLALGTGANAALYGVMSALLFEPPSGVRDPSALVTVSTSQFSGAPNGLSSYPDFQSLQTGTAAFSALSALDDSTIAAVRLGDSVHRVRVAAVSSDFFATIGLDDGSGLLAGPAPEAPPAAIVSHELWTMAGSPPGVVGTPLLVGRHEYTVAGIAPAGFAGLQIGRASHVWIALSEADRARTRGDRRLAIVGRLAAGTSLAEAARAVDGLSLALAGQYPDTNRGTLPDDTQPRRMTIARFSRLDPSVRQQVILITAVVFGATGLLLFSGCLNAGSLLLSRSVARRRELAIKVALGANRRLLVRQIVVESVCISLAGAACGLLFANWIAGILPAQFAPEEAGRIDTGLDTMVVAATVAFSSIAGVCFAIGPARHATRTIDTDVLRADAGGVSVRGAGGRLRSAVVAGQVALSTVLLIGAGLLLQSLSAALEGEMGAGSRGVSVLLARLPGVREGDVTRGIRFHTGAQDAVGRLGYASGWIASLPVGQAAVQAMEIDVGKAAITEVIDVAVNVATTGYFQAMPIPLVEGRLFNTADGALAAPVAVVNDVLARRYFGAAAVGRRVRDSEGVHYTIVGVVRSGRYRTLQEAPEPMVYFSLTQRTPEYMHLVARTSSDPGGALAAIRAQLERVDSGVTIARAFTFDQHLREALVLDRILTTVVAGAGLAALMLATIGVYGVIDDRVRRRTPEIGLRVALGANRTEIRRLVFVEGLRLTIAGSAVGICAAWVLARGARVFVHGLPPPGLASLAVVPLALVLVVLCAAAAPTRRALRISPTVAVKGES